MKKKHIKFRQWTGTNVGLMSRGTEGAEKALDEMKSVKDFDYIQRGMQAKIADKQQSTEEGKFI